MIMCSYRRIAFTARNLCARSLPEQIERLAGKIDAVVVREKDLTESEYEALAQTVLMVCQPLSIECVLHTFAGAARRLGCDTLHVPLPLLQKRGRPSGFMRVGTGVHSLEEVARAQNLGADYLVASHIFATGCKEGQPARGLAFLSEVVEASTVPVYALGGIVESNEARVIAAGAQGSCRMSDYMRM
ncbi:MAG: thiamine phosphate synthase [Raoultibacter sp.]